jgi:HTH-type transcriptional regulator / antitoxin HigA
MIEQVIPYKATHPGEVLLDELKARDIRQKEFASEICMQPTMLNEIIKGKRPVTADIAILFEQALDVPAGFWMQFQSQYELDQARIKEKNKNKLQHMQYWKTIKQCVPVRAFSKAGVIGSNQEENIHIIKEIYGIQNISDLPNIVEKEASIAFSYYRKSQALQTDRNNLLGWAKLVSWKAENEQVADFEYDNFAALKNAIISIILANNNTRERVREALASYGIKLVYQEKFEKTPVDGYTFWSNDNPAIAMTLRHKRIDNFAFTLFHELGHVYLHLIHDSGAQFIDYEPSRHKNATIQEEEANKFAKEALIPKEQWENFLQNQQHSDEDIIAFADRNNIHPAIVLGRLQYEQNNYAIPSSIDRRLK